ncbi:hypothetical protein G7075_00080 [Phycicoccus sp. HDW14]|uniref:hypothetical protein n=1 Tax=Phycicoccus sp. HDW14 TaxID=2714941 RepID=UPI00140B8F0B|nr:hypothetical protein [Phycicoccus sp. HDW14]QIM19894.1 hypothetical protein G7075_00080 [Phycicoccus sp. HDW14]
MTSTSAPRARERALTALESEAKYFRERAAIDDDVPDVRDLWLALADSLDGYVDIQRGRAIAAPLEALLFDVHPPP